jgi:flagella basal body P-ring formation protein FlgA
VRAAVETLRDTVRAALPPGSEVAVTDVALRGCDRLPRRHARLEVVPSVGARVGPRAFASLRLLDGRGQRVGQATLSATLAVRVRVLVAARTLPAGTTLGPGDLVPALVDPDRARRPVTDERSVLGLRTRRPLPEGEPLDEGGLARPQLVERGDLVRAVVTRGDLQVTSRGVALEDGRLGETIRLASPDGARTFLGRVTAESEVEVP